MPDGCANGLHVARLDRSCSLSPEPAAQDSVNVYLTPCHLTRRLWLGKRREMPPLVNSPATEFFQTHLNVLLRVRGHPSGLAWSEERLCLSHGLSHFYWENVGHSYTCFRDLVTSYLRFPKEKLLSSWSRHHTNLSNALPLQTTLQPKHDIIRLSKKKSLNHKHLTWTVARHGYCLGHKGLGHSVHFREYREYNQIKNIYIKIFLRINSAAFLISWSVLIWTDNLLTCLLLLYNVAKCK